MKVTKKSISFNYKSYYFAEEYEKNLFAIEDLIHRYDELSDEEKIHVYNTLFDIEFDNDEYLKILNLVNKTNYSKMISLQGKYEYSYGKSEPKRRIVYLCAANDDVEASNRRHSIKELKQLIESKQILPLATRSVIIDKYSPDKEKKLDLFSCYSSKLAKYFEDEYSHIRADKSHLPYLIQYIEENLDKRELYSSLIDYAETIQRDLTRYWKMTQGVISTKRDFGTTECELVDVLYDRSLSLTKCDLKK